MLWCAWDACIIEAVLQGNEKILAISLGSLSLSLVLTLMYQSYRETIQKSQGNGFHHVCLSAYTIPSTTPISSKRVAKVRPMNLSVEFISYLVAVDPIISYTGTTEASMTTNVSTRIALYRIKASSFMMKITMKHALQITVRGRYLCAKNRNYFHEEELLCEES